MHRTRTMAKRKKPEPEVLKGWQQIAAFLGQPLSVAHRWAHSGMPVRKQGRYVESSREELNRWLGRESAGEPVQIATDETDLSAELKRCLSLARKQSRKATKKKAA
jgi:phage terminase Nu1 subunit (DNA packaging protein)